jgi:predicted TIM-barrel fold metal-dependent hydrolase
MGVPLPKWRHSAPAEEGAMSELLISADSHVLEPSDLWTKGLPVSMRGRAPHVLLDERRGMWMVGSEEVTPQPITFTFVAGVNLDDLPAMHKAGYAAARPGGWDPKERLEDMITDGVSAEVLYPSLGLGLYWIKDAAFQEACFRAYNDWLIEYCSAMPERLIGIAMISMYDVDHAVAELRRCKDAGLRGALIWERPPDTHSFTKTENDPFWAAAQEMDMPVALHILTDHGYTKWRVETNPTGVERFRPSVMLQHEIELALFDLIFSGVLERFPDLKLISVENEYNWLANLLVRMDKAYERFRREFPISLNMKPSEYVHRQVRVTFFNDAIGPLTLPYIGTDLLMWSSDYPHQNSTWPHSRDVIARDLGNLPAADREKLVSRNVIELHKLRIPQPVTA